MIPSSSATLMIGCTGPFGEVKDTVGAAGTPVAFAGELLFGTKMLMMRELGASTTTLPSYTSFAFCPFDRDFSETIADDDGAK